MTPEGWRLMETLAKCALFGLFLGMILGQLLEHAR